MIRSDLKSPVKIFGIHGKAGAGKDTAAYHLDKVFSNVRIESFAVPLKKAAAQLFGIPITNFNSRDLKEKSHPQWNVSPRQIAQFMGTEIVRQHFWKLLEADSEDFWIRRMAYKLQNTDPRAGPAFHKDSVVVIPDVRFANEFEWILENNGVILHLTRPEADGKVGIPSHASEADLPQHLLDQAISIQNTGTISELEQKVAKVFETYLHIALSS